MNLLSKNVEESSAEIYAAIAAAIHIHRSDKGDHDIENMVLTINRSSNHYSPWSSKFLSMRKMPG